MLKYCIPAHHLLQEKLTKEEKATRFNLNKLNHQWRNIMREAKSKELKKDIEILSQTFERVVDRKESVIKSLVKDLLEAEEQYSMALRSHIQNVDNLTGKIPVQWSPSHVTTSNPPGTTLLGSHKRDGGCSYFGQGCTDIKF